MPTTCRVKCPVLLVHGNADETIPVADTLAVQENGKVNSLELLLIEDAGRDSVNKVENHGDQLIAFLKHAGLLD